MSYDVSLHGADGEVVEVDHFTEGGTYRVGGSTEAELNITYNYGRVYGEVIPGYSSLRELLDGKRADEVTPMLEKAVAELGTEQDPDYWKPTRGNAGHALSILLRWAQQYPNAVFSVD